MCGGREGTKVGQGIYVWGGEGTEVSKMYVTGVKGGTWCKMQDVCDRGQRGYMAEDTAGWTK